MKRYRLLKDLPLLKAGTIIISNGNEHFIESTGKHFFVGGEFTFNDKDWFEEESIFQPRYLHLITTMNLAGEYVNIFAQTGACSDVKIKNITKELREMFMATANKPKDEEKKFIEERTGAEIKPDFEPVIGNALIEQMIEENISAAFGKMDGNYRHHVTQKDMDWWNEQYEKCKNDKIYFMTTFCKVMDERRNRLTKFYKERTGAEIKPDIYKGMLMLPCLYPKAKEGEFWIFDAPNDNEYFKVGDTCCYREAKRGDKLECIKDSIGGRGCTEERMFRVIKYDLFHKPLPPYSEEIC
jgi:hypothetical protein